MTYEEFGEEIKKLKLGFDYDYPIVTVYDPKHLCSLVYISQTKLNRVIVLPNVLYLPKNVGHKLLTLCYELARTPLDERGDY